MRSKPLSRQFVSSGKTAPSLLPTAVAMALPTLNMSFNAPQADPPAVRLPPWRAAGRAPDPDALRPRKPEFADARVTHRAAEPAHPVDDAQEMLREAAEKGFAAGQQAARQALEDTFRRQTEQLAATMAELAAL